MPENFSPTHRARARRPAILKAAAALFFGGALFLALFLLVAGRWLVRQDGLDHAGAIVVLSGRMPLRAVEAAALYREGWAPQVWITRPAGAKEAMSELGVPFTGEEEYSRQVLLKLGVPDGAIRVLAPEITNTADEIRVVRSEMARGGQGRVIFVTTAAHTRRVHTLWRRLAGGEGGAMVRAARNDPFDPAHWYRTSGDALDVVREYLGLMNAWAGLPLGPAR